MTDREKLIELLKNAPHFEQMYQTTWQEAMAGWLISNGVTVQEWISAKTPPEGWKGEGGYLTNYYVYTPDYGVDIGSYIGAANRWLCMGMPCNVTHWMPLPEPPKEE